MTSETNRNIVVIDDERTLNLAGAIHLRNSVEGLAHLEHCRNSGVTIDELWLDHDLGGFDTIMPVVAWLEEHAYTNGPVGIDLIVIHTANPSGALTMMRALSTRWPKVRRANMSLVADLNLTP